MSNSPVGPFSLLSGNTHLHQTDSFYPVIHFFFFLLYFEKNSATILPILEVCVSSSKSCWLIACKHCCSSWRDGHVPNVNKHHAGWPNPACDPAPLSLHILALCLDCIRGLCWSLPLSQSILSSMHLNLSPYFTDASWECGRCMWPSVTVTYFLLFRRRRERADTQWYFRLPVRWITHQTGLTRSTKKKPTNQEARVLQATTKGL